MNLCAEITTAIDQVFATASADGRSSLYEFEVYRILQAIGLNVPVFEFVADLKTVDQALLGRFGRQLVAKIVSPQIPHKQKLGGVQKLKNEDPYYIQYRLERMREEVLAHFPSGRQPEIKGFLLVELIDYSPSLGYEHLIGFKEDPAFGPVLTLSKGGDDAEFFAKYFDPANLFLPPFSEQDAGQLVGALNIRHKFAAIGHPEYSELLADAIAKLSNLAYCYSFIASEPPRYLIQSMDINPFVITAANRLVAIDGFAEFVPAAAAQIPQSQIRLANLEHFFQPNGVAVIGVSGDLAKYSLGREIAELLHDLQRNDLYLINARGGRMTIGEREYPFYRELSELPARVDLVVYAAPAQHTLAFFQSLHGTGVKTVILISGIPAEQNYADFARQLRAVIPEGVRVIGPNCMGVYYGATDGQLGINTLFVDEQRLEIKSSKASNTVLLTQSGAFSVTAADKMQHSRLFRSIVSFGNKFDVKVTDLIAYFAARPEIEVIALYVEGLDPGEGRQFFELAQQIKKPLIVYKSGRTEAGARAAASHTASLSGSYDVFRAACQQAGVILTENIGELYELIKVFSLLAAKRPQGKRVAGVVNAGFESTVSADELEHLEQARLSESTIKQLQQINQSGLVDTSSPFLDITPMADDRMYADYVAALLQDESVDCVFVAVIPHAESLQTTPETCHAPGSLANRLVDLSRRYPKPMVVSVNAGRYYQEFVAIMEQNGLPVYDNIRSAIKSLDRFAMFSRQI